jgi:F-type H+-transporting ATPase subunit epsilon
MADQGKLQVRLVTPDRILLDEEVTSVEVPSKGGYLEVMAGASPVLARIGAGMLKLHGGESGEKSFVISRGIAEVLPQRVTILANTVEKPGRVDTAAAQEIEVRGQQQWEQAGDDAAAFQESNDLIMEGQTLMELAKQRHG